MQFELTLSPPKQRMIAATIAAIPALAIVLALASFVSLQVERHQQVRLLVRELARERAILTQAPSWHERITQIRSSPEWQSLFVGKSQKGSIAAIICSAGGAVEQVAQQRLEPTGAIEIDEAVVFSATTEQLSRVLQRLRGVSPLFVVRSISIQNIGADGQATHAGPNTLRVKLTVAEFERPS